LKRNKNDLIKNLFVFWFFYEKILISLFFS
jgi:hypothetical protein